MWYGMEDRREIDVLDRHDKGTAHDIEFMLALQCGSHVGSFGCTDTETELVVRDLSIDFAIRLERKIDRDVEPTKLIHSS